MSLRPWILGGVILIGLGVNAYLLSQERLLGGEKLVRHEMEKVDPLLDLQYTAALRESNLRRFGLDGDELTMALTRLRDLDDERNRMRLSDFMKTVNEPDILMDAACGNDKVRPRYSTTAWLVKEEGGRRDPITISRVSRLEREDWSKASAFGEVYGTVELARERQPDATVMGIAAVLLGQEQDAIDRASPWGQGLGARWSWDRVKKNHPGIQHRVVEYLALHHLFMEVAMTEGGFCGGP